MSNTSLFSCIHHQLFIKVTNKIPIFKDLASIFLLGSSLIDSYIYKFCGFIFEKFLTLQVYSSYTLNSIDLCESYHPETHLQINLTFDA